MPYQSVRPLVANNKWKIILSGKWDRISKYGNCEINDVVSRAMTLDGSKMAEQKLGG